jgi:hypothetical protein
MRKYSAASRILAAGIIAGGLAAAAALSSCATAPYTPSEKKVERLVALIDRGGVGAIKGLASAPFILDGEILLRQADVDSSWSNLKAAGFSLGEPTIASIVRIGTDSYSLFADTMDARVFFKKYLDKNSVLVALDSSSGRYYLILNREVSGYPRIQGFKGPVK